MSASIWDNIKGIIGTVAPAVASVIGTPVAGIAVKGLCNILGLETTSGPQEIDKALRDASPDTWLKIKELNSVTEIELKRLDIDASKIDQMEMSSARNREIEMSKAGKRDYTVPFLAVSITAGFFSLIALLALVDIKNKDIIDVMLGSLGTAFITIMGYYFGTSRSSRDKNKTIEKAIKT